MTSSFEDVRSINKLYINAPTCRILLLSLVQEFTVLISVYRAETPTNGDEAFSSRSIFFIFGAIVELESVESIKGEMEDSIQQKYDTTL